MPSRRDDLPGERSGEAMRPLPDPRDYCARGIALRDCGRLPEALASFERALALAPECAEAHTGRGIVLRQLQRPREALRSFDRALELCPKAAQLHNNRGNVLRVLMQPTDALESFERAIALAPHFAMAHNNRGLTLQGLGRYEEALACYRAALELQPGYADVHNNLGVLHYERGAPEQALAEWLRALELQPAMDGARGNISNALRDLERPEEALAQSRQALRENGPSPVNYTNHGNALFDLGRFAEALESYDRAIECDPRYGLACFNKSLCLLLHGDLHRGLRLYEWRKRLPFYPAVKPAGREWLGTEDITGKALYVYADQALGDTLQFCRYAKIASAHGARVVLGVQPQLRGLLAGLDPAVRVVPHGETAERCDFSCALMSLPLAFATRSYEIPAAVPYLFAEPQRAALWRRRIGAGGFKVGIVWQGGRSRVDVGRSIPLQQFASLTTIPGVRLISLQKGAALDELRSGSMSGAIEIPGDDFDDGPQAFLDSAALISHLDLIITCDTALAHLAGALNRPTWVALKSVPDWRWGLKREDCPWYPSVRLFRQSRRGDWYTVFDAIKTELISRLSAATALPQAPRI
jgi:tetratricopeptide (TPR) repeat protein